MDCPNQACGKGNVTGAENCEYCGTQLPITVAKSTDHVGKIDASLGTINHRRSLIFRSLNRALRGMLRIQSVREIWKGIKHSGIEWDSRWLP